MKSYVVKYVSNKTSMMETFECVADSAKEARNATRRNLDCLMIIDSWCKQTGSRELTIKHAYF